MSCLRITLCVIPVSSELPSREQSSSSLQGEGEQSKTYLIIIITITMWKAMKYSFAGWAVTLANPLAKSIKEVKDKCVEEDLPVECSGSNQTILPSNDLLNKSLSRDYFSAIWHNVCGCWAIQGEEKNWRRARITKLSLGSSIGKDIMPLVDYSELHQDNEGWCKVVEVVLAVFPTGKDRILESWVSTF